MHASEDTPTARIEASTRAVFEALNEGRPDRVRDVFSPAFVDHDAPPENPIDRDGFIAVLRWLHGDLGVRYEVHDIFGSGDRVCVRATARGVHNTEDTGEVATGRPYTMATLHVYRGDPDGTLVEHWGVRNELDVLYQVGALERPETPAGLRAAMERPPTP